MKKRLLFSLLLGGVLVTGLYAQDKSKVTVLGDLTSRITNADFSQGTPVTNTVRTYDYDMEDNGLGSGEDGAVGLFGQQEVPGWTAANPSDNIRMDKDTRTDGANARAAGLFAYADIDEQYGLGGSYFVPVPDTGVSGNALGMVAVWGGNLKYTQSVTLPAGGYMLVVRMQNVAGTGTVTSNMGFVTTAGTKYMSDNVQYDNFGLQWENDTILFRLTEETTGDITLGYAAGDFGSGSAPHLFLDNVKLYSIDTNVFDQAEIDAAKEELLELIEKGNYYEADTEASQIVYNDPYATLAQVLAAIENQKAINEKATTDLSEFFIRNAHFSEGEPVEGGICTYDYDCSRNGIPLTNYSMLDVPGWTQSTKNNGPAAGVFAIGSGAFVGGTSFIVPTAMSNGSTEGNLLGIVTSWGATAQYTQLASLPAGKYIISISYYNAGGPQAISKNLIGFIDSNGTEYLGETKTFPVGKWTSEIINFELDEETSGNFSIGYTAANTGSGNMPHLFVDGFSLVYIGTGINASLFALQATVSGAEKALDEDFYEALREPLEKAIAEGKALVNSTSDDTEANMAAMDKINGLLVDVNASIEAYKNLDDFYNTDLANAIEKYNQATYPELYQSLMGIDENAGEALDNCSWTTAQIEEAIASFPTTIKDGVQKAWDNAVASGAVLANDVDISVLFDQLAYTYSTTAQSGANVPDKEWQYGTATNFKTQYGTAEVWNQSPFTISRTLADMPAGKYTITTKAFFRNGSNETNYVNYDETTTPESSVFAGYTKTGLANVATIASEEAIEGWAEAGSNMGVYVPNSQQAAYNVFNNEEYTDLLQRSASTVLTEAGDLTFGVTGDNLEENSWTVWYTFSVSYNAPTNADLYAQVKALYNALSDVADQAAENTQADSKTQGALSDYEGLSAASSKEDLLKEIAALSEALEYTNKYIELRAELEQVYDLYNNYLKAQELVVSEESTYINLLDKVGAALEDGFSDNEQIEGFISGIKDGFVPFVQYPFLTTSSETSPGNITPVIYNYSFVDPYTLENNANGWTREFAGGKEDKSDEVYEFYNNDYFDINQTIHGLAAGYYRIRVQSFYRSANTAKDVADSLAINPAYGRYASLYATTIDKDSIETDDRFVALNTIFERGDEAAGVEVGSSITGDDLKVAYGDIDEFYVPNSRAAFHEYCQMELYWNQLDVYLPAENALKLGLRKNIHVNGDWCPFDNFELYYLGTTPPTGIQMVEGDAVATQDKGVAIYNLAGQRVSKAVKGLYIIGGKKVLVK